MNTKTIRNIHALTTLVAVIGLGLSGTAAHAADQAPVNAFANKVVSYSDLNLASSDGLDRLYHRIGAAARQVCGANENLRAVADKVRSEICIQRSIQRAVANINEPALTRLFAARSGRAAPTLVLADRR